MTTQSDPSVAGFFTKNAADAYAAQYDKDHGPRLDAMIERFNLSDIRLKDLLDVGGGLGFLGKRLLGDNGYWVVDGSIAPSEMRVAPGVFIQADLDYSRFSEAIFEECDGDTDRRWDAAFCLETLEHLSNPYNCLVEIKKLVKPNGDIYISIPHENVWHNAVYPGLLWPIQNFEQFLGQMSLHIEERWLWDKGWNAYHFRCRNGAWHEKTMLYAKSEEKFRHATPIEMVNL